ncbi:MAG: outer membrane beta-barrel protein [Deltaproteobacteria bacterium]|nr:outer membrane beta-barrel protein [Deltaproteobacteria bacterium]
MNRVTFTICCVLLLSGQAVGFAPIGPTTSDLDQGQFAFGFDYANGEISASMDHLRATYAGSRPIDIAGETSTGFVGMNSYYARLAFGLNDRWQVFSCLVQAEYSDSDKDFAWGFGSKVTLRESDRFDWGLMGQVHFLRFKESLPDPDWTYYEGQADLYTAQVALGPVYKGDGFRVYGGTFLSWIKGDGKTKGGLIIDDGTIVPTRGECDFTKDLEPGIYAGVSLDFTENVGLNAEYQYASDWELFGAGLSFKF